MFKEDLKKTMGKVLKENGYKEWILHKDCVYYLKRFSDKLAFYIRCLDSRDRNAGATIEMYFTAIQYPDDRITSLKTGLHIHILTVWDELVDDTMIAAGNKIIAIEQGIGYVSDAIVEEIKKPYFPNLRLKVYNEILSVYDALNEDVDFGEEFATLKKQVYKVAKKKGGNEAFALCNEFVDSLPDGYFENKGIELSLDRIKGILLEQVRAQCILGL